MTPAPPGPSSGAAAAVRIRRADGGFLALLGTLGGSYVVALAALLVADVAYLATAAGAPPAPLGVLQPFWNAGHALAAVFADPAIRHSFALTMVSCAVTTLLALVVAVPLGYLLARHDFRGRALVDALLDIPIVLPPLVLGISLLILFQFWPFRAVADRVVFQVPAVILAQFMVSAAFAARIMRAGFDQIDPRQEQVALTLGCTRAQAFSRVVLPQTAQTILSAGTIAWARALGEFGPLLVFAGATRMKTEVLSTTVFLELSIGNLRAAVAVSVLMVAAAVLVLVVARTWGVNWPGLEGRRR
ncbi:MAG: ABC transporter permease subunit [Planctomycetes bacterium]|nr:ABC transporter permease subunit [Planctomycetota bacterium]